MFKFKYSNNDLVKDANGQILWDGVEVRRSWAEYVELVPNVENVFGYWRMPVLEYCMKEQYR